MSTYKENDQVPENEAIALSSSFKKPRQMHQNNYVGTIISGQKSADKKCFSKTDPDSNLCPESYSFITGA